MTYSSAIAHQLLYYKNTCQVLFVIIIKLFIAVYHMHAVALEHAQVIIFIIFLMSPYHVESEKPTCVCPLSCAISN